MSIHGRSVSSSRLSRRSNVRDASTLAVHLGNDTAMRKLLRESGGASPLQLKYISLCVASRVSIRPAKDVVQGLGRGELIWDLTTVCDKQETVIIAQLLKEKEALASLRSLVVSCARTGHFIPTRKRGSTTKLCRQSVLHRTPPPLDKDIKGEVCLFDALCRALPAMNALRSLELDGTRKAFGKTGNGTLKLTRGLRGNSKLKALRLSGVSLGDRRAIGALATAVASHLTLTCLSFCRCDLQAEPGGRLVGMIIKAHASRRNNLIWSSGLRESPVPCSTGTYVPPQVTTAGCLMIDVSGNFLGDAGVHAIAKGLQNDSWMVGLNLSNNGVTYRGAAFISLCLHHNDTLCALVLDGNPDIGSEAEASIMAELEGRSAMPVVVLEEPEVVLNLASWGFSPHPSRSTGEEMPHSLHPIDSQGSEDAAGEGTSSCSTVGQANPKVTGCDRDETLVRPISAPGVTNNNPVRGAATASTELTTQAQVRPYSIQSGRTGSGKSMLGRRDLGCGTRTKAESSNRTGVTTATAHVTKRENTASCVSKSQKVRCGPRARSVVGRAVPGHDPMLPGECRRHPSECGGGWVKRRSASRAGSERRGGGEQGRARSAGSKPKKMKRKGEVGSAAAASLARTAAGTSTGSCHGSLVDGEGRALRLPIGPDITEEVLGIKCGGGLREVGGAGFMNADLPLSEPIQSLSGLSKGEWGGKPEAQAKVEGMLEVLEELVMSICQDVQRGCYDDARSLVGVANKARGEDSEGGLDLPTERREGEEIADNIANHSQAGAKRVFAAQVAERLRVMWSDLSRCSVSTPGSRPLSSWGEQDQARETVAAAVEEVSARAVATPFPPPAPPGNLQSKGEWGSQHF